MNQLATVTTCIILELRLEVGDVQLLTLDENKDDSTNNGDGVERKIHDVSNDGLGAELCKGTLDDLA